MFQQIADKWVRALTSGKFPQTDGTLRNTRGYCCLGVLCELYRREHEEAATWEGSETNSTILFRVNKALNGVPVQYDGYLPPIVAEWAGMSSSNGRLGDGSSLASMNDAGTAFTRIAEVISANAREL